MLEMSTDSLPLTVAWISVLRINRKGVLEKRNAFLANPNQGRLPLITVADRKFSVIAGGFLSLVTLFYSYRQLGSLLRLLRQ